MDTAIWTLLAALAAALASSIATYLLGRHASTDERRAVNAENRLSTIETVLRALCRAVADLGAKANLPPGW